MTLEEIYYISQVVASVAVIASLVYLALQTRHAARSTRAAMHENRAATVLRHVDKVTEPDFQPIWVKGLSASADMSDADVGKFSFKPAAGSSCGKNGFANGRKACSMRTAGHRRKRPSVQ